MTHRTLTKQKHPKTVGILSPLWSTNMFNFRVLNAEVLRWPITMSLLGLFSLFCLLLFIGAIVHSRATLIVFSVCGLFSIILLWLLASIYVTMAVALAGRVSQ